MLYATLLQGKMFLVMLYFGVVCGIFLTTKKLFDNLTHKNKIIIIVSDILFLCLCSFVFIFTKIKFCYGEFRVFQVLAFLLGIIFEQFSLNNLVEKILNLLYNVSRKVFCKLKKTKFFGKIFKWEWKKNNSFQRL